MKHICETIIDYNQALCTSMQGDEIYCTRKLWDYIEKHKPKNGNLVSNYNFITMQYKDDPKYYLDDFEKKCLCEYCEVRKSKDEILGYICKQCMEEM